MRSGTRRESKALPRSLVTRADSIAGDGIDSLASRGWHGLPAGAVCAGGAVLRAARARGASRCCRPRTIRWRSPTAALDARVRRATVAVREIEAALDANDAELAKSFVDLADDRGVALPPELDATSRQRRSMHANSARAHGRAAFASGLITGEPKDMAGLAGTALGDLFVFGDIRDAVREGSRYVSGETTTSSSSASPASASPSPPAPMRRSAPRRRRGSGSSLVKAARKTGRLSARDGATGSAARCARWSTGRAASAPARVADRAGGRGAGGARGGQGREGGRPGAARQRRRPVQAKAGTRPRSTG